MTNPDYSSITSHERARELVELGNLTKFYLYPARFGGTQEESDSRYLPPEAAAEKAKFDRMVSERYDDGRITGYMCRPIDSGDSLVPTSLKLIALSRGVPMFVSEIHIWNDTSHSTAS